MSVHHLLRESVLLTLIKGSDRIDRTAIITALGLLISVADIDSLGNLGNLTEWYVILKSTNSRQDVLKKDELIVGDQVFIISEPYKHVKTIRLLNLPPSVPDEDIRSIASKWGGIVLSVDPERLPRPFDTIKTFVRRIRIRFSSRQDEDKIPITIKFSGFTVSVQLEGRQKVCYRCKQAGHIKAECKAMKCQKCQELGHDDPNCQQKRSYAAAVVFTSVDADRTPALAENGNLANEPTFVERAVITPSLPQRRLPFCRRCKQSGHKRIDCPSQESPLNQLTQHGENNHVNSIEDTRQETPSTPVVFSEKEKENNQSSVISLQPMSVDDNSNTIVTAMASALQQRIMFEAYKNPNNDYKRTCADRSIDSDLDIDPKKPHTYDSSNSTLGEDGNEEGEVVEN